MGLRDLGKNFKISQRPLDIIYVIDTSGSMGGTKIQSVNKAMHELEILIKREAKKNPTAQVNIRILTFGGLTSKWHIKNRVEIENFNYEDINYVEGMTPFGHALGVLCDVLGNDKMPSRGLKPIIVLMSDGWPSDDWKNNLKRLNEIPWGQKAIKIAIAIGNKADKGILEEFTNDPELVLEAKNSTDLKYFIKWTSTLVTHSSKYSFDSYDNGEYEKIKINIPHPPTMLSDDDDEFM